MIHLAKILVLVSIPTIVFAQTQTPECRDAARRSLGWGVVAGAAGAGCGLSVSTGNLPGAAVACPTALYALGEAHRAAQDMGRHCRAPSSGARRAD